MASIISAAAGQLRRAWPLFAASILTRFDRKVTLNWISLSNISHAFLIYDQGDAQLLHLGIQSRSKHVQWSSKVCIQNQSLLSRTIRVRRQLNLTGGTVR